MKRIKTIITCGVCLLVTATAAVGDTFSEVPTSDPAYKLLAQLSEAGWREQSLNTSGRVARLTRYEFALEVSKVMQRVTAQAQKDPESLRAKPSALHALRGLTAQFRPELEKLGVDVAAAQKMLDDALKSNVESERSTSQPAESPSVSSQPSRFISLPPLTLNSELNPLRMKDFGGAALEPLVMTSIGSGLLAVDRSLKVGANLSGASIETGFFRLHDALSREPQRLIATEFKLPVTDNFRLSASLAELRSLARGSSQKAWSADAEYALGRWKLDASLRFAGSDQLASALLGVPQTSPASFWRSMGGGVTYTPKDWLNVYARISGATDLTRLQSNYIISSGGFGISLKDRISLEVGLLHVNPFDPARSSSLSTRLGLRAALSPTLNWQLFYQRFDDAPATSASRPSIVGTQVSVKF